MEIEVFLKQWNQNHPVEQMEEGLKILSRQEKELEDIHQNMARNFQGEEWNSVRKNIRRAEEMLHEQISHIWDMKIALEKTKRLYETCENEIIETGEEVSRRMPEQIGVIDLTAWNPISFQIKKEGE
ncbi:MAG: hypothetical protein HFI84_01575 [Eubacterium sp.]|nr:hypothetical protein [Eubacterium sp.]